VNRSQETGLLPGYTQPRGKDVVIIFPVSISPTAGAAPYWGSPGKFLAYLSILHLTRSLRMSRAMLADSYEKGECL
jgi:hypothetical protein